MLQAYNSSPVSRDSEIKRHLINVINVCMSEHRCSTGRAGGEWAVFYDPSNTV